MAFEVVVTTIREQYLDVKTSYEDAILFFRMGDFYECFDDDARVISEELDLTLTKKNLGKGVVVPLAGIPIHACDGYLGKLVRNGHKVAICEQLSDPTGSKGLVDRGVVRVVTPGTVYEDKFLDQHSNNYLICLKRDGKEIGLAYVDISTGEFAVTSVDIDEVEAELARLEGSEILIATEDQDFFESLPSLATNNNFTKIVSFLDNQDFGPPRTQSSELLNKHMEGLDTNDEIPEPMFKAVSGILSYLTKTQFLVSDYLRSPVVYRTNHFMILDQQTRINLEIFDNYQSSASNSTLFKTLNYTHTSMGARLLKKWIGQPLIQREDIVGRLDAVDCLINHLPVLNEIEQALSKISDLERIVGKVKFNRATPNDLIGLKNTAYECNKLADLLEQPLYDSVQRICSLVKVSEEIIYLIESAIDPEWSGKIGDGKTIKLGFSEDLDRLRGVSNSTKDVILNLEAQEKERTGIKNLRIRFNQVFGYYIEISKSNLDKVPEEYIRKQTLTNAERFITAELKDYELEILTSNDKIEELEKQLFSQICAQISSFHFPLLATSYGIAKLDVMSSFARIAIRNTYTKPHMTNDYTININDGRHPVVEQVIGYSNYVSNDLFLSRDDSNVIVLTGPNMAGKSTYIRQIAIIVLMAHIGSFVPAAFAEIGIVDRIFTRIGLQDDLTTGQSTFMVEMVETADIIKKATSRSLLILDEIGRGTSTYDGLAIAQSVIEYIHNSSQLKCKTLFATHYHELSQLADTMPRIQNYHVAVSETNGEIIFLRRILRGSSSKSYGIHVAKLAGMPKSVLSRAEELLEDLENEKSFGQPRHHEHNNQRQLHFSWESEEVLERLSEIDVDNMTPLEAMNFLNKLKSDF